MESKRIAIIGATGSVGMQALDVVKDYPQSFNVIGMSAFKNWETLARLAKIYEPTWVFIANSRYRKPLEDALCQTAVRVLREEGELLESLFSESLDILLACASGTNTLSLILGALERGIDVGLANKEALLVLGPLLKEAANASGAKIIPVDSEHAALERALKGVRGPKEVLKFVLTSSGGPFWRKAKDELKGITKEEALRHPVWRMGAKITVDSATLMNKAFELIEACLLFDIPMDRLEVWIHPQGILHGVLELLDGQQIWVVSEPDMRFPIAQALFSPGLAPRPIGQFRPFGQPLEFFLADEQRFEALRLAREAFAASQSEVIRLVAANEVFVERFLQGGLHFWRLVPLLESFMGESPARSYPKPLDLPSAVWLLQEQKKAALAFLNSKESISGGIP